jgi:arylsulfatase A-like enzyme
MKSSIAHLVRHVPAVLLLLAGGDLLAAEKPPRPDVLVIMPDQMRGDCLSILDHAAVRTPHLDELARQGALFRRAYTTVPSCIPARHALLTGLFPQTSGVVGYAGRRISSPTMPQSLRDAGYATGPATGSCSRGRLCRPRRPDTSG